MKLYIMNCGQMITPDGNILAAFNTEQLRLVIPVPAYLIEHPTEGLVLIDCGFDYNHLPDEMKYGIAASPLQRLTRQIERLGYRSEDVRHVVISHLHFDHAGQMRDFPKATFHMRESEWSMAIPPSRGDYIPADYMAARAFRFDYIPENTDYDLFGDGTILCLDTKGHSPGHTSFLIALPHTGNVLLTVDAAHMPQYFETDRYYQDAWDVDAAHAAVEKLKKLAQKADVLLFGHDPASLAKVKQAPDYSD